MTREDYKILAFALLFAGIMILVILAEIGRALTWIRWGFGF
jgi:hypothetical protein